MQPGFSMEYSEHLMPKPESPGMGRRRVKVSCSGWLQIGSLGPCIGLLAWVGSSSSEEIDDIIRELSDVVVNTLPSNV